MPTVLRGIGVDEDDRTRMAFAPWTLGIGNRVVLKQLRHGMTHLS
jgi:hypothetical protein